MSTYREQLWELAIGQYGYVSTTEAGELGVPDVELRKIAARRKLQRVVTACTGSRTSPGAGTTSSMRRSLVSAAVAI